ncbi:MAG: hypothetical protein CM15mV128_050 [Caudoviricetes sp.]|nr:MAG: hypothetical protein CM15mV128_050 [Caudoviricetes sp.]
MILQLGKQVLNQADTQDLPGSGGQVVAITSGEVGYVFRQNQIIRMDFVGGNSCI